MSLRYLLHLDIASHPLHVIWIFPGNGLVSIGQQAFNKAHGDKDDARYLVSSGHNKNKLKLDEKCIGQKVVECVNSNWKYVEYCNKNASKLFDLFFFINDFC